MNHRLTSVVSFVSLSLLASGGSSAKVRIPLVTPTFEQATTTSGGYYVKLFQHPSICPLTSFCWPWNPSSGAGRKKMKIPLAFSQHLSIRLKQEKNLYSTVGSL